MPLSAKNAHRVIIAIVCTIVVVMGITLFCIPPALSSDLAQAFQVLRSMQVGYAFNTLASVDPSDISKTYTEFFTWWSPGQYLVPYLFKLITGLNIARSIAVIVTIAGACGLTGFYYLFTNLGFSKNVAALSLLFIIGQYAFMIPYVYYNGGEVLLFAFEGWFLYGCIAFTKPGLKMVLFVLLSGLIGFFFKSSFLWMYVAGLFCLWIRLSAEKRDLGNWIKKALWLGIPAIVAILIIYFSFVSRGPSPASVSAGFKFTIETFTYPLASPVLSGFSVDEFFHGVVTHLEQPVFSQGWYDIIVVLAALLSVWLIISIIRWVSNKDYKLLLIVFYIIAVLLFGISYWRQVDISMEPRHFRVIGLLIVPGIIYLVMQLKLIYKILFAIVLTGIFFNSYCYLIKGYKANNLYAKGILGIPQTSIDQTSLNALLKLDAENHNLTFALVGDDTGLELLHNRIIPIQPIEDDLKLDTDDYVYTYKGHGGPLYIVLPKDYSGAKEKLVLQGFPGYQNFSREMLSPNYVLYIGR